VELEVRARTFYTSLLEAAEARGRTMALVVPGERDSLWNAGVSTRIYTVAAPHSPLFDRRYRVVLPHRLVPMPRSWLWRVIRDEAPDVIEIADKFAFCHVAGLASSTRLTDVPPRCFSSATIAAFSIASRVPSGRSRERNGGAGCTRAGRNANEADAGSTRVQHGQQATGTCMRANVSCSWSPGPRGPGSAPWV